MVGVLARHDHGEIDGVDELLLLEEHANDRAGLELVEGDGLKLELCHAKIWMDLCVAANRSVSHGGNEFDLQ